MKTLLTMALAAVLTGGAVLPLAAQKPPDFTGTWEEDVTQRKSPYSKPVSGGGPKAMGIAPEPVKLLQTGDRLIIEHTFRGQVTRVSHDLDGRENRNHTGAQIHTTRTRWEGTKLVTEGTTFQTTSAGEESWTLREVRWLTPRGEMAEEVTRVHEDGGSSTVLRVFRKLKPGK